MHVSLGWSTRQGRKCTLIIVRTMLTEPKTALAGVMLEASFARFRASIDTFNMERASSRRFCCLEFAFMVGTRGSCEITVWRAGCAHPHTDERPFCHDTPRAGEPFDGKIVLEDVVQRDLVSPVLHSLTFPRGIAQHTDHRLNGIPRPPLALEFPSPVVLPEVHRERLVRHIHTGFVASDIGGSPPPHVVTHRPSLSADRSICRLQLNEKRWVEERFPRFSSRSLVVSSFPLSSPLSVVNKFIPVPQEPPQSSRFPYLTALAQHPSRLYTARS